MVRKNEVILSTNSVLSTQAAFYKDSHSLQGWWKILSRSRQRTFLFVLRKGTAESQEKKVQVWKELMIL